MTNSLAATGLDLSSYPAQGGKVFQQYAQPFGLFRFCFWDGAFGLHLSKNGTRKLTGK